MQKLDNVRGCTSRVLTMMLTLFCGPSLCASELEASFAGRLVVQFEGGEVGPQMAEVVQRLSGLAAGIPTRDLASSSSRSSDPCATLAKEFQAGRFCDPRLVNAIRDFGNKADPSRRSGTIIPDLKVESYKFRRDYDLTNETERRKYEAVARNPEWQKVWVDQDIVRSTTRGIAVSPPYAANKQPAPAGTTRSATTRSVSSAAESTSKGASVASVELDGIRWIVPLKDVNTVEEAELLAFELTNGNRFLSVELGAALKSARPKRQFANYKPSEFFKRCIMNDAKPDDRGSYSSYLKSEYDAEAARHCEVLASPITPIVHVIDAKIGTNPDLAHAVAAEQPAISTIALPQTQLPLCLSPGKYARSDHGTYLAGIIASSGKYSGFVGIHPKVKIKSIFWGDDTEDIELADQLNSMPTHLPQVFLFASMFNPLSHQSNLELRRKTWKQVGTTWSTTELLDENVRWKIKPLNRVIANRKLLMVVSAGQVPDKNDGSEDDQSGVELRRATAMAPQHLGDLTNVIVTTACSSCDSSNAGVWSKANYSTPSEQVVHLAAPGGDEVPGFADGGGKIAGDIRGTSSAAAFVAGTASQLLACYPDYYLGAPGGVKNQLLITARFNLRSEDRHKAPAGTIDPHLAMIDPKRSWLKLAEQPMKELSEFHHWCQETVTLRDAENTDGEAQSVVLDRATRRVTQFGNGQFLFRRLRETSGEFGTRTKFEAHGPGRISNSAQPLAAVTIPGIGKCALRAGQVQDLILSAETQNRNLNRLCNNITVCGE